MSVHEGRATFGTIWYGEELDLKSTYIPQRENTAHSSLGMEM
jgi:hypothetical protein